MEGHSLRAQPRGSEVDREARYRLMAVVLWDGGESAADLTPGVTAVSRLGRLSSLMAGAKSVAQRPVIWVQFPQ